MTQDLKPEQEQTVTKSGENLKRLTDWLRQNSVLIVAVGWGVAFLCFTLPFTYVPTGVIAGLDYGLIVGLGGLVAGAATALSIYVETKPSRAYRLFLIPVGLFATQWLLGAHIDSMNHIKISDFIVWIMLGCAGPVLISVTIDWIDPGIQKIAILLLTWAPLAVIGSFVAVLSENNAESAVIGLCIGALEGWVMIKLITRARRSAESTK